MIKFACVNILHYIHTQEKTSILFFATVAAFRPFGQLGHTAAATRAACEVQTFLSRSSAYIGI
jgi:hypothetical protein